VLAREHTNSLTAKYDWDVEHGSDTARPQILAGKLIGTRVPARVVSINDAIAFKGIEVGRIVATNNDRAVAMQSFSTLVLIKALERQAIASQQPNTGGSHVQGLCRCNGDFANGSGKVPAEQHLISGELDQHRLLALEPFATIAQLVVGQTTFRNVAREYAGVFLAVVFKVVHQNFNRELATVASPMS